ncbi:MAG: hypothetical protein RR036_00540 [Oscillospiraceae bacterium]
MKDQPFVTPDVPQTVVSAFAVTLIIGLIVTALLICITLYFFKAIGVYRLSKNRGYKHAGIAFIPIVGSYVLGGIYDDVNRCAGKRTKFRVLLLLCEFLVTAVNIIFWCYIILNAEKFLNQISMNMTTQAYYSMLTLKLISAISTFISFAFTILLLVTLAKIYKDYDENHCTIFTVLSVFGLSPFILFAIRNKKSISRYYLEVKENMPAPSEEESNSYQNFTNPPTQL